MNKTNVRNEIHTILVSHGLQPNNKMTDEFLEEVYNYTIEVELNKLHSYINCFYQKDDLINSILLLKKILGVTGNESNNNI